ncbi:MAG: Response regulator of zinc sigma-54-dependent two-component system [Acidobacteria bacterium]|nr:Response regulator of zinc sigma-54-dependent two-component system [Acidobacteriota bacterium]
MSRAVVLQWTEHDAAAAGMIERVMPHAVDSPLQTVLIVDDDPDIADALAMLLERPGRELIVCGDLESAEIVIERMPVAGVITDVRLSSPFRFEGLDFIKHIRRHSPKSVIVLMTGANSPELENEAIARGAAAVLTKPFDTALLDELIPEPRSHDEGRIIRMPSLDTIVTEAKLFPLLQPIVRLAEPPFAPFGYESLARCETPSILALPDALFDYAHRKGRVAELELACIRATFAQAGSRIVNSSANLFINLHPSVIVNERLPEVLEEARAATGIAPERVVLEITEQESLGEAVRVARQCAGLRGLGYTFALDDVGVAYSHLTHVDEIRPTYLKISQHFGTSFEADTTRTKIVHNILSLAHELGCELVLEGIETAETRDAAREAGIPLGQGFLFGRPSAA